MNVVVVESPAKAKTINKYLGSNFTVLASYGHVRDLPAKDGSVRPDDDFAMDWEVDPKASKRLSDIAAALKGADRLILATDPDREGEAISWHVLEVLRKKRAIGKDATVQRVTFNAITKSAVTAAMAAPRDIDMELVDAYLARRALDYLVGFTLSPVLWRKLPGARSAGRVQSVALQAGGRARAGDRGLPGARILERGGRRLRRRPTRSWRVSSRIEGRKLGKFDLADEAGAHAARAAVQAGAFTVRSVEKKPARRSPPPPFTTSTLQQEASRKLGFNAQRTMQAAQKLYEGVDEQGGLITYMRTDGVASAPEALAEARQVIAKRFGDRYVPESARHYKSKAKNAQEAHEAIRPTSPGPPPLDPAPGRRSRPPLRADLAAHGGQPDGAGLHRAHHRRDRDRRRQDRPARHRPGRDLRRLPRRLRGGPRREAQGWRGGRRQPAACPPSPRARPPRWPRPAPTSTSPSRRRAIPRPAS